MAMNLYHLAILEATDDGQFMELADCWRSFHLTSEIKDCECDFFNRAQRQKRISDLSPAGGVGHLKKLYVPVTRKVSLTNETFGLPNDHVYF
jgi:hypothetical protein